MSDDDFHHQLSYFQAIPDFDGLSRNGGACSISNLGRARPELGRSEEEVDECILRGPFIEFEGHIDIRASVIRKTAEELGMVSSQTAGRLQELYTDALEAAAAFQAEAAALQQELDTLRAAVRGVYLDGQPQASEDMLDHPDRAPMPYEDPADPTQDGWL